MHRNYTSADGAVTLVFEMRSEEGEIAFYSDLSAGPITFEVWNGEGWTAYTTAGSVKVLDATTNHAIIQGPGQFRVIKPTSIPMSVAVSTKASIKAISGF